MYGIFENGVCFYYDTKENCESYASSLMGAGQKHIKVDVL